MRRKKNGQNFDFWSKFFPKDVFFILDKTKCGIDTCLTSRRTFGELWKLTELKEGMEDANLAKYGDLYPSDELSRAPQKRPPTRFLAILSRDFNRFSAIFWRKNANFGPKMTFFGPKMTFLRVFRRK